MAQAQPLHWEQRTILEKTAGADAKFTFVEIMSGPPAARDRLNAAIRNFDSSTDTRLNLADILMDGALPRLTTAAEAAFRKDKHLGPQDDLKTRFNFPEGFRLPAQFGIGKHSLLFTYNLYEIGGYAQGETTIELPYPEIRDLLKPGIAP
jgi:hypothetical protein